LESHIQRNSRLDFLKTIAISLVLFWHLQPIKILETKKHNVFSEILRSAVNFFNYQITLVAVPVFLLISLYLFYQKAETSSLAYLNKRFRRLTEIFLFWFVCQFAFFYGVSIFIKGSLDFQSLWHDIPRLLMCGGPPLPIVGGSVFYFVFVLLILVLMCYLFIIFRKKEKIVFITSIAVVAISISYFEVLNLKGFGLRYWRLENFVIYVPFSYFLFKCSNEKLRRLIPLVWVCFIIFSIQDIFLRHQGYSLGAYSRVSIVFGSTAIFSSFLQYNNLRIQKFVSFLAKYSLGIFATHKYLQLIVILIFIKFGWTVPLHGTSGPLDLYNLAVAVTAVSFTFASDHVISDLVLQLCKMAVNL
jgi:surface polysaccharide O-acyltransferase-like enzyme